ncbi:glycosyltransferase [Candidatus Beckwithbacteria bacterium]|nr:glycosyltransferase [Candidatus Beckwithbacteria bacterium]
MKFPKISILCLAYNHEKYISQTIDSFLMQKTNFDYEILIHDDASTDKTPEILKEYQKKFPNIIKLVIQKENQLSKIKTGILKTFLLPSAKGKYIALCEGDDYWIDAYKLQKAVDSLDQNSDCIMFAHNSYILYPDNRKELLIKRNNVLNNKFSLINQIYTHTSARVFRNIKNLPPGDIFQYHYLLSKGNCYYYDKPLSVYRYNHKGVWSSVDRKEQEKFNNIVIYLINIMLNYKYNNYYSEIMPTDFQYFKNNYKNEMAWILYYIHKNYRYSDIFNPKTNFIKFPNKDLKIWTQYSRLEKYPIIRYIVKNKKILKLYYKKYLKDLL